MAVRRQYSGTVKARVNPEEEITFNCNDEVVFNVNETINSHDEGKFIAEFTGFRTIEPVITKAGKTNRVEADFKFEDETVISQSILLLPYSNQLFYKLVVSITGTINSVNLKDLIGGNVMIQIKHHKKDEATFANVVDIFPIVDDNYEEYSDVEEYEDKDELNPNSYQEIDV